MVALADGDAGKRLDGNVGCSAYRWLRRMFKPSNSPPIPAPSGRAIMQKPTMINWANDEGVAPRAVSIVTSTRMRSPKARMAADTETMT